MAIDGSGGIVPVGFGPPAGTDPDVNRYLVILGLDVLDLSVKISFAAIRWDRRELNIRITGAAGNRLATPEEEGFAIASPHLPIGP